MLRTKHKLGFRGNRRLSRNKKSFNRNRLIKVSRSNQKEWSEGVTQWFTRRQIKRINNKYRLQIISYRQSSEEEWKEGFDEWSDQKILRKANRWLNRMRASGWINFHKDFVGKYYCKMFIMNPYELQVEFELK